MEKWLEIFERLTRAGIETYPPGGHIGICQSPYCVVQSGAGNLAGSSTVTGRCEYRIYLVVPIETPAVLDELAKQVRMALEPMVSAGILEISSPRGAMTPHDGFSALISYIDYNCCYSERN